MCVLKEPLHFTLQPWQETELGCSLRRDGGPCRDKEPLEASSEVQFGQSAVALRLDVGQDVSCAVSFPLHKPPDAGGEFLGRPTGQLCGTKQGKQALELTSGT
eukprot:1941128-Rhodomonas_salina.1